MGKKILVTVEDDKGNQQKLVPQHADNLIKRSKFFKVVDDPRTKIDPQKESRDKKDKKD